MIFELCSQLVTETGLELNLYLRQVLSMSSLYLSLSVAMITNLSTGFFCWLVCRFLVFGLFVFFFAGGGRGWRCFWGPTSFKKSYQIRPSNKELSSCLETL